MKPTTVVLATHNAGKLAELQTLLAPLGLRLCPQPDLGLAPAAEPHPTFVENALAKARHAARACGHPALADDSGLCVDALGGAPGVHSARYAAGAGEAVGDEANNRRLLRQLEGREPAQRAARFVCVLVGLRCADDPEPLIAEGRWHGRIALVARGAGGFGYDPVFEPASTGGTAAELGADLKNRLSHRAQAVHAMAAMMRSSWGLGPVTP